MNIVETLLYVFEADTKPLEQGTEKASKNSKKLGENLTEADKAGQRLSSTFLSMAKGVGAGLLAGFSVAAISALVKSTVDHTDALADQAQALGVSVGQLDLWDAAATSTGGKAGAFATSLATVNERIQDVARKGSPELLAMFQKVGLSLQDIRDNASDPIGLLREMADEFAALSEAEAAGLGKKLGLDSGTVNLLRQGRMGLEEVIAKQRELGYITDEQAEAAGRYNDVLDASRRVWDDLRRRFVTAILPALTWVGERFQDLGKFVKENSTFVVAGVGIIAAAITGLLLPAMVKATAATWALIAPWLPLIAGVTAFGAVLALVVDDLYNFMKGNESVTGHFAAKWPIIGDIIRGIGETVAHLIALVVEVGAAFVALFTEGPKAALDQLLGGIDGIGRSLMEQVPFFASFGKFVESMIGTIVAAWQGFISLVRSALGMVGKVGGVVNRLTGGRIGAAADAAAGAARFIAPATASAVGAVGSAALSAGRGGDRTNTVNIDKVEVNTQATDADGIAKGIGKSLGSEMRNAADQFDDGVLA